MRLLGRLALRIAGVTAACLLLAHGNLILFVSLVALITFLFFAYVTIRLVPF